MDDMEAMLRRATKGEGELPMPLPPKFSDPAQEREYIKQRLAVAYRIFAHFGFDDGLAGHITVRDPIDTESFWLAPVGIPFAKIQVSHLVRLDHQGQLVEGKALVNTAAFAIHSRIHAARADVHAVAHAHTRYGRTWSTLGQKLDPITQDACVFFENHSVFDAFTGVVEDLSEGDAIAETLGDNQAVILQNHGLLTAASSVDMAVSLFIQMERCCETQLLANAAGEPKLIPAPVARKTREFNGSDLVLWGNFQPLYQKLVEQDPQVLS